MSQFKDKIGFWKQSKFTWKKGMENITYAIQSIKERYKTKFT
jgi:hypothetical protein